MATPEDLPPAYATVLPPHCSTCTRAVPPATKDTKSGSPTVPLQQTCCGRWVCGHCIDENPRFAQYCPFCPASTRILPPSYTPPEDELPPDYAGAPGRAAAAAGDAKRSEDVLHFVRPADTVATLSVQYGVPADAFRRRNRLFADHLLQARRCVLVPAEFYRGPSLSATPVEGEEEDSRKSKLKRFQLKTKCVDPGVAEVYLKEAGWEEAKAERRWLEDEKWAREHPMKGKGKGVMGSLR